MARVPCFLVLVVASSSVARAADPLADLEDAHTALFERVAPAVVVLEHGRAIGAAFAVAPGLLLTAAHVVDGAEDVAVTLPGGRVVRGTVVERSTEGIDLALVRVSHGPERILSLEAPPTRTGAFVATIGHGDGNRWTLATGIVANAAADGADGRLLRLQLPLRPGASGAPVVDRSGNVIGIVTQGGAGAATFAVRAGVAVRSLAGLAALAPRARTGPLARAREGAAAPEGGYGSSAGRPTP